MLKTTVKPHRKSLRAATTRPQKVYVMLKLIPSSEVAATRPPLALALVVDTSASMRMFVDQEEAARIAASRGGGDGGYVDGREYEGLNIDLPTLLDQAIEAAHTMIDDPRLQPNDQVAVIHFDDTAKALLPLTPLSQKAAAHDAIESLRNCAGETQMAQGLRCAIDELQRVPGRVAKRVFVLTDGATADENECRDLLARFGISNAPLIGIGFGQEYNEKLLVEMANATQGRPYHLQKMEMLTRDVLNAEIGQSAREVVTDLQLDVAAVKGVQLESVTRVHPAISEVIMGDRPYRLGNIGAGDYTIFILEFSVSGIERAPSRARLARLSLSGNVPGESDTTRRELPPQDVFVEFSMNELEISAVDSEVLGYVQQKNVGKLVEEAIKVAPSDPAQAQSTLQVAVGMTQKLGNTQLGTMLNDAIHELDESGEISGQTVKTVSLGLRTKTVKTQAMDDDRGGLSPEEIRRLTGT